VARPDCLSVPSWTYTCVCVEMGYARRMSNLALVTLAATLSVAKGAAANERPRLTSIANDIAAVVESQQKEVFTGEGSSVALAVMLVAIAKHESEFQAAVDSCARRGDGGRSITMFQILRGPNWAGHKAEEICGDRRLAIQLTINLLARPLQLSAQAGAPRRAFTPQMIVNAYATGSAGMQTEASKSICGLWEQLARGAGLEGAQCGVARSYAAPRPSAPAPVAEQGA